MSDEINGENHSQELREPAGESSEFEEVLANLEKAEAERRKKGIIYGLSALIAAVAAFAFIFFFHDRFFQPDLDVESGEQEVAEKTNDPQCRGMIAEVQELSDRYFKLEPAVDEDLLGDDPEAIEEIRDEIARLQQRLDEIAESSEDANLRFEESREQLDEWFDYVEVELGFLDRLAEERLAELSEAKLKEEGEAAKKEGDAAEDSEAQQAEQEGVVVKKGSDQEEADEAPKKTPRQRKDGALVAIHDAFQKFRVWHSSSLHPCGAADEGEEPWQSEASEKSATDKPAAKEAPPAESAE
ncbi:MAG: hypothetical protein ACOC9W_04875 [Persicimonas sp.]